MGTSVVLFMRQKRKDARGVTMPYLCLGTASYQSHEGGRPMQVMWRLDREMPAGVFQETKVAAG